MLSKYNELINEYASDILNHENVLSQKKYMQHGKTSIYYHTYKVTVEALKLSDKLKLKIDKKSLIRGCLLHDYFLYDWHENDKSHRLHGFSHARKALENAKKDFELNKVEENMIYTHMFPLNLRIPKYKESILLCLADKISAVKETINRK